MGNYEVTLNFYKRFKYIRNGFCNIVQCKHYSKIRIDWVEHIFG